MWTGRSLLTMDGVDSGAARSLLDAAHRESWRGDELAGKVVANLFFEDSTRTRVSFSMAAQTLGAKVVDLTSKGSSVAKGETLLDTAWTIEAMGVDAIVVRSGDSGVAELIDEHTQCAVLNAGDGTHQHPTQALTDALTIGRSLGLSDGWDFGGLRVAIVGDVVSSRVARSNVGLLTGLGAEVVLVGPPGMAPSSLESMGCRVTSDFDSVLGECDAVMMLRIQFERGGGATLASTREYHARFGMNEGRLERMKDRAIVMHPGPMNRGVEISASVADGERSVVLEQVRGGVLVRQAAMAHAIGH
ncbi:MAG: aspartate carbamoyltransferase catalytic subunit [Phycisphaerales bacterium]|nr:aspartate carbamoyltransferase catalytic subunit [Phycisphaerales bacterium]